MIRSLGEGNFSLYGPDLFEKKAVGKPEWPEKDPLKYEVDPILGTKDPLPMFNEQGKKFSISDLTGHYLDKKI